MIYTRVRQFMCLKDFLRTVTLVRRLEAGQQQALRLQSTNIRPTSVRPTSVRPTSVRPTSLWPTSIWPTSVWPTSVRSAIVWSTCVQPAETNAYNWTSSTTPSTERILLRLFKNLELLYKSLYPKRREHNLHLHPASTNATSCARATSSTNLPCYV